MRERKPQNTGPVSSPVSSPVLWHVPVNVDRIAANGQHFDLVADATTRAAVAKIAGLRDLPRFEAAFDVIRHGDDGLHVTGVVSATAGQNCVVTLEPLDNEIEEPVDLVFLPQQQLSPEEGKAEPKPHEGKRDGPEPLIGGSVDLGALATEFLILGLDPYPRKPDAVFEPPADYKPEDSPFVALAKLAKDRDAS